jgi:HSP20 family protein
MHRLIIAQGHQDLGHLARHMTDLMHRVLASGFSTGPKAGEWTPAIDVCEMPDRYEVTVELAGVRREVIEVYTEGHTLTIAGWRGDPMSRDKVCVHQMEIEQGHFLRRLGLPADAEENNVSAHYREGLLVVRVGKRPAGPSSI